MLLKGVKLNLIFRISTLLIVTSSAFASDASSDISMTQGFYGGLGPGVLAHNVEIEINGLRRLHEKISNTEVLGQIYLGYQKFFKRDYGLQIESFFNYANNKNTYTEENLVWTSSFSSYGTYGIKAMPFYKASDTIKLFIDLGLAYSKVEHAVPLFCQSLGVQPTFNKYLSGLVLGAGSEIILSEKLSMRGEYQYINYATWTIADPLGGTMSYKPNENLFVASIIYRIS